MNSTRLTQMMPLLIFLVVAVEAAPAKDPGRELCQAAKRGQLEKVQELAAQGADPNWGDHKGHYAWTCYNALYEAAERDFLAIARVLLESGADPNLIVQQHSPLQVAARSEYGYVEMTRLLLEHGADVDAFLKPHNLTYEEWMSLYSPRPEIVKMLDESRKIPLELRKARAQERLRSKDAARELEQRGPRIEEAEQAGDTEGKAGRHREALSRYMDALRLTPARTDKEQELREKIIRSARALAAGPELPEKAEYHGARAEAFIKRAKDHAGYLSAAKELDEALLLAPWWGPAYFNLGLVQEKLENPGAAIRSLKLYLLASPDSPDAKAVRKKLIDLAVAQEIDEKPTAPQALETQSESRPKR